MRLTCHPPRTPLRRLTRCLPVPLNVRRTSIVPPAIQPFPEIVVLLARGQWLALDDATLCAVQCLQGEIHIVRDGSRALPLESPTCFVVVHPGTTLIRAVRTTLIRLTPSASFPMKRDN